MPLATLLKKSNVTKSAAPVWQGPCGEGPQGGITQGLLSRYFVCPERFRIYTVEGLRPAEGFSHRLEYGNMWHACEEALAAGECKPGTTIKLLNLHCQTLCRKFPLQQQDIDKWYNVCRAQFPLYVDWWSKYPDVKDRTPLLAEKVFDVPYPLPSGRVVRLRGKWDSVDLIGKGKNAGVWLQENKSKGDIDEPQLRRQLSSGFDLQTMTYLVALNEYTTLKGLEGTAGSLGYPIRGVRYNVIRRPLSGGRGSIVQKKGSKNVPAETTEEYHARLTEIIRDAHGPEWGMPEGEHFFFMRWNVNVLPSDIERFRRECLDPVLENLCDDFEWWKFCKMIDEADFAKQQEPPAFNVSARELNFPHHRRRHFVTPFGIYNTLAEGGGTDLDEHLRTGSEVGLHRCEDLFPELK